MSTDIGSVIAWLLAFVTTWQLLGASISIPYEQTVKKLIDAIFNTLLPVQLDEEGNELPRPDWQWTIRSASIVLGVFVLSAVYVVNGSVNLLADIPFSFFSGASAEFIRLVNILLITAGAFLSHEFFDAIIFWLNKARTIIDVIESPSTTSIKVESDSTGTVIETKTESGTSSQEHSKQESSLLNY